MFTRNGFVQACLLAVAGVAASAGSPALAAQVVTPSDRSFDGTSIPITFKDVTFTVSGTGDFFNPTAIQTGSGGAVRSFGGFLGIPITPSTDFPGRGSAILEYGPGMQFTAFPDTTTIPYSNGDNYLGLQVTSGGQTYYGYLFTTDVTLNSYGFETTPDTAFVIDTNNATAVPEAATWALMIVGFAGIGAATRRSKQAVAAA